MAAEENTQYQNIFHYDSDEDLRLVFPSDSEEPIVISTNPKKVSEPPTDINENIFETLTISTPHKKHCSGTARSISEATDLSRPVEDELLEANSESNHSCLKATDLSRPAEDELLEANSESNQSCLESSVWRPWEQTPAKEEPAKEDSYSSDEGSIIIDLHSEICRPISRSSDVVKQDIDSQGRAEEGSVDHELQSEGAPEQQIEADCQDSDSGDDCVIIAHFQSSKHNIRRAFEQIKPERQDSGSDDDCVIIDEIQSNKHKTWRASKQIIPYWQDSSPGNDGVVLAKIQSQQKEMDSDYFTQTPSTARGSQRQSVSCRTAGTIHKIQMRNFMCHDNLEVELNPRINFIIGKNGSGKSAIQTAIAVGLGCKALATNRGSSIKALIKNDKTSCTISIAINNQGESAYKPDVYGPYIKVERMFSQTGGSYKIKDSSGKVVSEQKRELDRIVNHFNIQPENPLCILQQDTARNFLNSSDPKKKYTFYMKASRLGDISNLYNESVSKVIVVKDVLESKFQSVAEAFHDVLEMKKKIKIMEDARSKRDKCANLEKELLWAEVNERKVELKKLQKKYEMHNENMKNLLQQLKELQENNGAEKLRELESQLREMDEMVEDARKNLESAKQKYLEEKDKYAHSVSKFKETKESKRSKKYKYDSCLTEIEKLVKSAPEIQQKQERLKAELNSHREELTALKAAETTAEHDRQQLNDTADVTRQNLQSCEQTLSSLKTRKGKTADQIKRLNQSSNNLSIYGDHIAAIVEEVERAARQGKFSQKPIGPIGTHISVRDQQWAAAVEHFLQKGFLSTFCVDNPKDSAVLSNIIKSVCSRYRAAQPSIICSKFLNRMHNIRESESVTEQYRNLVRALDIDHPVVANCLIDQMEAETVLLIPTNGEAYQLLDEAHKVPRNCKRAFTLTGDQFVPAPNYKSYSAMRPVTRATLLQAKQEDLIREFTNEIKKLTEDIGQAEREKQTLQKQLGDISTSMRKNDQELRNIKKRRRDIEDRMRRIGEEISDSENQTNIGFLEEESQELKRHYESESLKCEELKTACEEAKAKFEAARADFENHQSTIEESNRQKAPVLSEIQRLRSIMQQATSKAENINCQLREQKSRAERIESRIKEVEEELAVTRENASQSCEEEVETNRSKEEIEQELNILRTYLQSLEAELGGSIEVLQDSLRQRQRAFDVVTKSLNDLRSLLKKTNESLKQRRKKQELLQRIMMSSAKHNFQIALKERNFEGKLEFDMEQETLQIKVSRPQSSGQSEKRLETSSLSGGEKSYSTVCFIMALWHEIELPFHFMDEFDVFMDGINRKTVIDMLLGHARNINQQFVFLTPLDASCIPEDDNITIHRLAAPRQ